ncbi:unnamed protein product [Adineta steineri]|uniref:Uncharacterized protein n=1 Tax=Adineta steineri TaxID=433720 RepID=A0A818W9Z9_9BILA|nr:unnamed protein product [Adineta steineri]CAF3722475.1 unnamed protein product [Adineta steineri]CAF3780783.1 unnamed protein product [Adineta steineri]
MAQSTQITIDSSENDYLNPIDEKPIREDPIYSSTTVLKETSSKTALIFFISGLIIYGLFMMIPIPQLYIGQRYAKECPVNYHIPHYLLIAGLLGLIAGIIGLADVILANRLSAFDNKETHPMSYIVGLCCLPCISRILNLFLVIWFIFGCYWVYRVKNIVQYTNKDDKNYCHPILYKFTCWILLFVFILEILKCCHCFGKAPGEIEELRKAKTLVKMRESSAI